MREKFLAEMERVVPWKEFYALIAPFCPKAGKRRPPVGLERMIRIRFPQNSFHSVRIAAEEAPYSQGPTAGRWICSYSEIS
jgi:IS5 family transposase